MTAQILLRDLHSGNIYVNTDPPPINAEIYHFDNNRCCCRRRIVSTNNPPSCRRRVLPSENPEYETVDFYTTKYISRDMALNIFILTRPPRSGLGVIKMQEEKREREGWMRYNVVAMLSHWKLDKMKT